MASNERTFMDSENEYEPLDTLQIRVCNKNGIDSMVSGIHIGFMEARYYVLFKMPPDNKNNDNSLTVEEEEWLEYMIFLEEDLHWLLKLPHHRFWSQIVHDEHLHRCLESYLSQAPRNYDIDSLNLKEDLLSALRKIHKLVFLVYLRMSTYKESKKYHLRPKAFGDIIYDNFIFDIPKVMDLCALYGFQNSNLLSKMVQNIFSTQPKYKNDLDETSKDILTKAFISIEEKLLIISSTHRDSDTTVENNSHKSETSSYCDLIRYITDVSVTLHAFLENYPPSSEIFHQHGALLRIPTFYEQVFTVFEKEITRNGRVINESLLEEVKRKVILSKTSLIRVFRNILNYTCIQNILHFKMASVDEKICASTLVDGFFDIIMELVSYKNFISDYNLLYPFDTDLELFNELGIKVEAEKVNYIFCIIHDNGEFPSETFTSSAINGARPKVKPQPESDSKPVHNIQSLVDILRPRKEENPQNENSSLQCVRGKPSEIEIDSLIQSVLDVLQGHGDGFIEKCLEFYNYDAEKVIDAVLSDSLHEDLSFIDINLKRSPNRISENESYSILSERKSIFDNDEFDMFNRKDVNMQNIHIGKKNKTPATYQTLQNDEESEFLKQLTLSCETEETDYRNEINIYEDEYDDTYDSMVGLKEPTLEDEPDDEKDNNEQENIQENENSNYRQPRPDDFCMNPEILRERAEQRRLARGGHNRSNRGGSRPADQSHNRQQKDRNKSYVGNHNRRKQSDFKKSRGMMPFPTR